MGGLALLGLAVVPLGAFSTLRQERLEQTLELITLTALSPRRIVIGKLMAQVVKLMTLFAAIAPFITMSFLLGGIDLATILLSLVALFMASVWVSALFLLLSATSKSRAVSALVFGAVALVGLFGIPVGRSLFFAVSRGMLFCLARAWVPGAVPWRMFAIVASFWLASLVNLVLLAENRLSSPTGDAVTPLRLGLLAQFLLMVGWALTYVGDSSPIRLGASRCAHGRRHRAPGRRVVFCGDGGSRRVAPRAAPDEHRDPLALAARDVRPGRRARGGLRARADVRARGDGRVASAAGGASALGRGRLRLHLLLHGRARAGCSEALRPRATRSCDGASRCCSPWLRRWSCPTSSITCSWQRDVLDVAFSLRHLINPFRTLANWSVVETRGWVLIPSAIGLIGILPG